MKPDPNQKVLEFLEDTLKGERESLIADALSQLSDQIECEAANGLNPKKSVEDRYRLQLEEMTDFGKAAAEIFKGSDVVNRYKDQYLSGEEKEQFLADMKKSREIKESLLNSSEKKVSVILQEAYGISDFAMNCIYKIAYNLLNDKFLEEAKSAFVFLLTLNSFIADYYLGLATTFQRLGQIEEASAMMVFATVMEPDNPQYYLFRASLLLDLNRKDEAKEEVLIAEKLIAEADDNSPYKADLVNVLNLKEAIGKP